MNDLVKSNPVPVKKSFYDIKSFDVLEKMAVRFSASKIIPTALQGKPNDVFVILQMGLELDVPPMQALAGINVIQGKATISPQLMIALIRREFPGSFIEIAVSEGLAVCTMARDKKDIDANGAIKQSHVATWDMNKATLMGLTGKDNWKKQPDNMLKWRAISECARVTFPDVIMGLYTPEELDDGDTNIYDQEGAVIGSKKAAEATVVPVVPKEPELTPEEKNYRVIMSRIKSVTDSFKDKDKLAKVMLALGIKSSAEIKEKDFEEQGRMLLMLDEEVFD